MLTVAKIEGEKAERCVWQEGSLKQSLEVAYLNNNYNEQCNSLANLAKWHMSQKNYSAAAKLLNGALTMAQKHGDRIIDAGQLEKELLTQLKKIEPAFITEEILNDYKDPPENQGINLQHKQRLVQLREKVRKELQYLKEIDNIFDPDISSKTQKLFKMINEQVKVLVGEMLQDCMDLMPVKPPCNYALIGTGSLAREEMTPYSDLECFILIEEDNPEYKRYFRQLSQLFELKIINLGETDLVKGQDLLPAAMFSPTTKGFSLDIHKTPTEQIHELIGTPEQLASYQLPGHYVEEPRNHLSGSLINTVLISGDSSLLADYSKRVKSILQQRIVPSETPLHKERALIAIRKDKEHFKPNFGKGTEGQLVQVKEDLYRLPNTIMDALALYYSLSSSSTWDRVDELCNKYIVLDQSRHHLQRAFSFSSLLRLESYFYYDAQLEKIDLLSNSFINNYGLPVSNNSFGFKEKDFVMLFEIYKVLVTLNSMMTEFSQSMGDKTLFKTNLLYDENALTLGVIAHRLLQYDEAIRYYKASLDPWVIREPLQRAMALNDIGRIYMDQGNFNKALSYFERSLAVLRSTYGQTQHHFIASILNNMGAIYREQYKFDISMQYLEQSLMLRLDPLGKAASIDNMAALYHAQRKFDKAKEYYEKSLALLEENADNLIEIATRKNNIGYICLEQGQYKEAKEHFDHSHQALRAKYGDNHPKVALGLGNIGHFYLKTGQYDKALEYFEDALKIQKTIYGQNHPDIATCLCNIAGIYIRRKYFTMAPPYLNQALAIASTSYGQDHPNIATTYNKIGAAYKEMGDYDKAWQYHIVALNIRRAVLGDNHPDVATSLGNIGVVLQGKGDSGEALKYFEQSLRIFKAAYGENQPHPNVAKTLCNMAIVNEHLHKYNEALEYHKQSLVMLQAIFGKDSTHQDIIESKARINLLWQKLNCEQNSSRCLPQNKLKL